MRLDVLRGLFIISVAIASSEAKGNPGAVVSAAIGSRREIRRQLAASSGKKEGHSAVGMKRKGLWKPWKSQVRVAFPW